MKMYVPLNSINAISFINFPHQIVSCMKENTECPLKCSEEVYKYIDCCDARRLNLIKQRMNEEARKREAEKKKAIKEKQKQKQK